MALKDLLRYILPVGGLSVVIAALVYLFPRQRKLLTNGKEKKKTEVLEVKKISHDTKLIRLSTGGSSSTLGLPTGKHLVVYAPNPPSCLNSKKWNGRDDPDDGATLISRKYTPVTGDEVNGYVDLVIKVYRPGKVTMPDGKEVTWEDGGKMSLYLDSLKAGDLVTLAGPIGLIEYFGEGNFKVPGRMARATRVGMMAGGTGITPMLQIVQAAVRNTGDRTVFSLLYANKTQDDILVRDLLDQAAAASNGRFKVSYTLDFPPEGWKGFSGFITQDMIKDCLPPPSDETLIFMCGPPPMVEHACKKNLLAMGYPKSSCHAF